MMVVFFIITDVVWKVPSYNGGTLMQKVTVKNGEIKEIVMTH